MKWHYLNKVVAKSNHRLQVCLVGCGGTGTHVLTNLAMINEGLKFHGRPEMKVKVFDFDQVEPHNIGRQSFSKADVGQNKAKAMVERINRFYGYSWEYSDQEFQSQRIDYDILISAVDTVKSRTNIEDAWLDSFQRQNPGNSYWMDIGNGADSGQVILSAIENGEVSLPTFYDQFGHVKEDDNEPSCSAVESLAKQDMFINKYMATLATNMLWTLLINFRIHYRGLFANMSTLEISPILIT